MPRHTSKSGNDRLEQREERAIKVEKEQIWKAAWRVLTDRRTRMIIGVLLLGFAIVALIAYVSYLFTGTADQSVLAMDHAGRVTNRELVRNLLGLPGARLAHFLIDGTFGFVSVLLLMMVGIYALRLMHVLKDIRALLMFCGGTFWVLWGSIVLGFAQQMVHLGVFRWGGAFGAAAAEWLVSYVNIVGTIAILGVTLVIFLIVTDPQFTERCKALAAWCKNLFKRKPKPEPQEPEVPVENEGNEVTIDLPLDEVEPAKPVEEEEVSFTIEPVNEEEPEHPENEITLEITDPEPEPEPLPEDGGPTDGSLAELMEEEAKEVSEEKDPNLEIEDVNEDELYSKDPDKLLEKLGPYDPRKDLEFYKFPSLNLLKVYPNERATR